MLSDKENILAKKKFKILSNLDVSQVSQNYLILIKVWELRCRVWCKKNLVKLNKQTVYKKVI